MKKEQLVDAIGEIDDEMISEAYEKKMKKKVNLFEMVGKLAIVACCACLLVLTFGSVINMGSMKTADYAYVAESNDVYDSGIYSMNDSAKGSYDSSVLDEQRTSKIIVNGNLDLNCEDLDETLLDLKETISEFNGYIQSEDTYGGTYRSYYATVRIPANSYSAFKEKMNGLGNVNHYSESREDVTDDYYDTEGRLENLRVEKTRIQELYKSANTISEILEIETRLSDIEYEIERYESKMKNYNLLTEYSTLSISIQESHKYESKQLTFFERIARSFTDGFSSFIEGVGNFIIGLVYYFWVIVFIGLGVAIYIFVKKRKKKKSQ